MGLKIHIGTEIECDGMEECSLISMPFSINENEIGTIIIDFNGNELTFSNED